MCNIYRCNIYNQPGTPGTVKSFLGGSQILKICSIVLTYAQHIFPGGGKQLCRGVPGYRPEHMFEEPSAEGQFKR